LFAIEREINGTAPQERARVRNALSWRLSITMEAAFCVETLEDALARHGNPEILNRAASSPARHSMACSPTTELLSAWMAEELGGTTCSSNACGGASNTRRCIYEPTTVVSEARASIGRYLDFYNPASQHPSFYVVEENRFCWSGCLPRLVGSA
jgi:putative transposase